MRKRTFAVAVLSIFLSTAMAQQPKSATATRIDPCTLATKAEVQEAVGSAVADPKPNPQNAKVCDFKVGDYGGVSFMATENKPSEPPDKIMAALKKQNLKPEEVQGIGDKAFFVDMGYGMMQLNAFKGSNYIIATVMIPGADEAKKKAVAQKVMKKALAKLP